MDDMKHYLLPVLSKVSVPTNIKLNIRTNNLSSSKDSAMANSIDDLVRDHERDFPKVKVAISEITEITDSKQVSEASAESHFTSFNTMLNKTWALKWACSVLTVSGHIGQ